MDKSLQKNRVMELKQMLRRAMENKNKGMPDFLNKLIGAGLTESKQLGSTD